MLLYIISYCLLYHPFTNPVKLRVTCYVIPFIYRVSIPIINLNTVLLSYVYYKNSTIIRLVTPPVPARKTTQRTRQSDTVVNILSHTQMLFYLKWLESYGQIIISHLVASGVPSTHFQVPSVSLSVRPIQTLSIFLFNPVRNFCC
jgi:hypothetical protein